MTIKNGFLLLIGLAALLLITTKASRCTRAQPVTKHQDNRRAILKADSAKSRSDSLERAQWFGEKQVLLDSIKHLNQISKVTAQKDDKIEQRYRQAPSVAGCDSVITSKNMRIAILETVNRKHEAVDLMNDSLISSYQGSLQAKDVTIGQLNAGYEQATKDLEKAKRPRRWGLGIAAGYGVGPGLQPGPVVSVGLSYNFIRL